jgi:hypothetical protein
MIIRHGQMAFIIGLAMILRSLHARFMIMLRVPLLLSNVAVCEGHVLNSL